ncbi:MAG: GNAT family N-acetyltransferase [Lachnospiraceae bacterium]|jgi:ribosomal-protein-alanine N-acetyltransferase|nr:GNAT family N-acetyltransferase [Lachnospiraceae bacterium]
MITHKGTQTLHTERLILRKFTVDDAQAMFENWASDERVTRYLTWCPHTSPESTKKLLDLWCAAYKPDTYNWVLEYEGAPIGNISVVRINEKNEWAELGYCMGYAYWNKGLMPEAAKAVINFLFTEIGVNRIGISHAVKNPASGRVAQKCGLTLEGTKREYFKTADGEFLDISEYGILRSDWEKSSI